jgi:hypothetical protein
MISRLFNNIGIHSLGIAFTAQRFGRSLPLPKLLLIAPLIAHQRLLDHLSRSNVVFTSIERLLVDKIECFANFNARFYDSLCDSVNAVQFLVDIEIADIREEGLQITSPIAFDKRMGQRAAKIEKAAPNIAKLLELPSGHLYSSLRIQL